MYREDAYGKGFWVWLIRKDLVDGNLRKKQKVYEKRSRMKNEKQLQLKNAWWRERDELFVYKKHRFTGKLFLWEIWWKKMIG